MRLLLHELLAVVSIGAIAAGLYAAVRAAREEGGARTTWRLLAGAGMVLGFIGLAFYRFS